ncbi:MAG: hypothetical protein C0393_03100 [Anaerolinea sp.]|nr:hypothetical protein [Anaerolinea sp.]
MKLIVLDTNVLVSGLLHEVSIPGNIVDLAVTRKIRLAVDERILQEYDEVTIRPYLGIPHALRSRVITNYVFRFTRSLAPLLRSPWQAFAMLQLLPPQYDWRANTAPAIPADSGCSPSDRPAGGAAPGTRSKQQPESTAHPISYPLAPTC